MPIHVAITRRVRPGHEAEFQQALREFFQSSFTHDGVFGATMLVPVPGNTARDYGILRTFVDEAERDAFYQSPAFATWEERARMLTEGEPAYRQLHGLEAWFEASSHPPPRWKMAVVTSVGVYVLTLLFALLIGPSISPWPLLLRNAISTVLVVVGLTWVVMPLLTRLTRGWLRAQLRTEKTRP
jgi:antibiotic biosynthesis monooxygenase (ABM) superfamily enzyme